MTNIIILIVSENKNKNKIEKRKLNWKIKMVSFIEHRRERQPQIFKWKIKKHPTKMYFYFIYKYIFFS